MIDIEQIKKMTKDELYEFVDKLENEHDIDELAFCLAEIAREEASVNKNELIDNKTNTKH